MNSYDTIQLDGFKTAIRKTIGRGLDSINKTVDQCINALDSGRAMQSSCGTKVSIEAWNQCLAINVIAATLINEGLSDKFMSACKDSDSYLDFINN